MKKFSAIVVIIISIVLLGILSGCTESTNTNTSNNFRDKCVENDKYGVYETIFVKEYLAFIEYVGEERILDISVTYISGIAKEEFIVTYRVD